ncbi:MAG: TolC family protein [Bacteroidia bacterium]|nr:TolC family protein [Bacteroidia bacterium]
MLAPFKLPAQDTLQPLAFLELVSAWHPVARQAALLPEQAQARLRLARGGFDPKIYGTLDQKDFKGSTYYRHLDGGVKLATWPGIEFKSGYEQSSGDFLNPEDNVPDAGLVYAGISVPLGQGLVIDARRAAVQQARIFAQAAEADRITLLNDLYFNALAAYWEWSLAWARRDILRQGVDLAQIRFNAVRQGYQYGDEPAVDTLEAVLTVQSRMLELQEAELGLQQAALNLSVFLWDETGLPRELAATVVPSNLAALALEAPAIQPGNWTELAEQHPLVLRLGYDLRTLDVERRFKADKLKPKLFVDYNLLSDPLAFSEFDALYSLQNNFKWGVNLSFPLLLREERGNLELTRLKIQETSWKQDLKRQEVLAKMQIYDRELANLEERIGLFQTAIQNYQSLLRAEEMKFQAGESSIFLINARESKLLEARLKEAELKMKYFKADAGLQWAAGRLAGS